MSNPSYHSTFLLRYSGPDISRDRLYYVSSVRYPRIPQPQPIDRVLRILLHIWQTIYTQGTPHGFYWAEITNPTIGDCYCVQRQQSGIGTAQSSPDWVPITEPQSGTFADWPIEVKMYSHVSSASSGEISNPQIARLEYRLAIPNNTLVFMQFVSLIPMQIFKPFKPSDYPITAPNFSGTLNAMLTARAAYLARSSTSSQSSTIEASSVSSKTVMGATSKPQSVEGIRPKVVTASRTAKRTPVRAPPRSAIENTRMVSSQIFAPLFNEEPPELLPLHQFELYDAYARSNLRRLCRSNSLQLLQHAPGWEPTTLLNNAMSGNNKEGEAKEIDETDIDVASHKELQVSIEGTEEVESLATNLSSLSKYHTVKVISQFDKVGFKS